MSQTIPFTSLKYGQRYTHQLNGKVNTVFRIEPDAIIIKRDDGWLIRATPDLEIWTRQVIPLTK